MEKFDLIVIGAGPGGYVAAIRGAQLGLKTAIVEREHFGGVCLNWGCIPTKALLRSAEVYRLLKGAKKFGVSAENIEADLTAIVKRSRQVSGRLSKGIAHLMKKNNVTVFDGEGRLNGQGKVAVSKDGKDTADLTADNIILATGARPRAFPGLEPDGKNVWSSKEAMIPEELPKSLLVIGSGAIGVEFASFYNTLGTEVTIVELQDKILPVEDADVSDFMKKALTKQGIAIKTGASVEKLDRAEDSVKASIKMADGNVKELTIDKVIVAVGIVPNVENIGLEDTKIKQEKGHIVTDAYGETHEKGIYAIGDLTAPPWLAHKASHEAIIAVEKIAGLKLHTLDKSTIPGCTYCHPQVASVGLTESAAIEAGHTIKAGSFPFQANGKAIALGETDGFIKTIFDAKTGELLGAHMVGAEVTEMIQGLGIAKVLETTEEDLMNTVFPHPTLSEMIHESVLDAYGRAIHF